MCFLAAGAAGFSILAASAGAAASSAKAEVTETANRPAIRAIRILFISIPFQVKFISIS
jgi:hypothetical protein